MSEQTIARVPSPSTHQVRHVIGLSVELWRGAMFLKAAAFNYMRDRKNPFANGLLYLVIIGVIVGIIAIVAAGTRYAVNPTFESLKNTVQVHLQAMPFYLNGTPALHQNFDRIYEQLWQFLGPVFLGYPVNTGGFASLILGIFTTPLAFVISWAIYGVLVHIVARDWDRTTSYGALLGTLSLASSPQLLKVFDIFPATSVSTPVIVLWTFIINIIAIKFAYHTTGRRAFWAAIFPVIVYFVFLVLIAIIVAVVLIPIARSAGGPR